MDDKELAVSRYEAKGRTALAEVEEYLKPYEASDASFEGKATLAQLDLRSLKNVKSFKVRRQDVMAVPNRRLTKDGYEKSFQTNHLGHFVLTAMLALILFPTVRVTGVSSEEYQFVGGGLDMENHKYGLWSS
ncbi:hypothetical protein ACHAWF_017048 [Thalassiosira exigua]